jgi:F-type H+-transporting ATPase subunit gamma
MQNTRQILQRIKTAGNISKITKAMEMVSASKMRRAQAQALATRPYTEALQRSLTTLAGANKLAIHPMLVPHNQGKDVGIIYSTDKGLCGSMNAHLFKYALDWSRQHPSAKFIVVGKKAVAFAQLAGLPIHAQFTELPDFVSHGDVLPISHLAAEGFLSQNFRSVTLIYTKFISTLVQRTQKIQVLPLTKTEKDESVIDPASEAEYIFEPSATNILDELLPYYIENALFQSLLESKASEHSARMVSMKNASENAKELMHELRLDYNKSRQTSITNELLDITTATLSQAV